MTDTELKHALVQAAADELAGFAKQLDYEASRKHVYNDDQRHGFALAARLCHARKKRVQSSTPVDIEAWTQQGSGRR